MKIFKCCKCGKPLGELIKGKVHKDINYICTPCLYKTRDKQVKQPVNDMPDFFEDIFKDKI